MSDLSVLQRLNELERRLQIVQDAVGCSTHPANVMPQDATVVDADFDYYVLTSYNRGHYDLYYICGQRDKTRWKMGSERCKRFQSREQAELYLANVNAKPGYTMAVKGCYNKK